MRDFALMALVQFVSYVVLTINYRAVAVGHIRWAMLTDAVCAAITYFIVRKVSHSDSYWTLAGMMVGGSMAAAVGIWMTRAWQ